MNEADRRRLSEKKNQVQAKQVVAEQSSQLAKWWLPTLQLIRQQGIEWQLEYFTCATGLHYTHWQNQLQQNPWLSAEPEKLLVHDRDLLYVHDEILTRYPGHNPLRYFPKLSFTPDLYSTTDQQVLTEAFQKLGLKDGPVYVFFMRLQPVLVLRFSDLVTLVGKGLFDLIEDICITPANYNWLIFRSLEEEWQFGHKE